LLDLFWCIALHLLVCSFHYAFRTRINSHRIHTFGLFLGCLDIFEKIINYLISVWSFQGTF
jgi:hypothetical protein